MARIWVYSGGRPSNGAKELASKEDFLRLRDGKHHKIKPKDLVINWGCSEFPNFPNGTVVNSSNAVKLAADKLKTFKFLLDHDVKTVEWTVDQVEAIKWYKEGRVIVARKKLTGHSGEGILIIDPDVGFPIDPIEDWKSPLYTKYVYKTKEFRVHVVNGEVVDTQQKIKDPDREVVSWKVRSHANGFIFARNNVVPSSPRDELAIDAVKALGLDFGAVDIIEDKKGNLYVLEINTAPGLEGQTIDNYATAFRSYLYDN